jgi:signal transduction histidine kinase
MAFSFAVWKRCRGAPRATGAGGHRLDLPEVTFCAASLEQRHARGQAADMWTRLRELLEPMNLAAYLAWLAIGSEVWSFAPNGTGLVDAPWLWPLVIALHAGFLVLFVLRQLLRCTPAQSVPMVLAQLLVGLVLVALARYSSLAVLLIVAMAQLAQLWPPRWLLLAFVAVNATLYLIFREIWAASAPMLGLLINASFQLFAMMTAWYAHTAQRSRDALAEVNADLLATRSLLAESVRDSERLRLSRELHDVAGHKLTALKLNLGALRRQPALADNAQLALCTQLADELLGDIRGVVQQMRLHDGVPLREMIERLAAPFPKPRLRLSLAEGLRVASFEQAEAVLRTVQEALTNAARHGGADNLWLDIRRDGEQLRLELHDDGRGGGELRFGNGLTGMRERLEAIGGGVDARRGEGGGVRLSAWLPVAA